MKTKITTIVLFLCSFCTTNSVVCMASNLNVFDNNIEAQLKNDTIGACNAEKIFIVAQLLEDPSIVYDGSYKKIPFPNGDIDPHKGVCTDLIIRTLRIALHFDLQKEVYNYRKSHKLKTDTNIDHRQCVKLVPFFEHLASSGIVEVDKKEVRKGSVVFILGDKGVYSHTLIYLGDGYMIHNIGHGQVIEKMPEHVKYKAFHFK